MKTKEFNKKLVLSKETIANLDNDEMKVIRVGNQANTCEYGTICESDSPIC